MTESKHLIQRQTMAEKCYLQNELFFSHLGAHLYMCVYVFPPLGKISGTIALSKYDS